jgi:tRNA nucleotidyltransferase (CCA-adding enzyme)
MLEAGLANTAQRTLLMKAIERAPPRLPLRFACLCHALDATPDGTSADLPRLHALCTRWRVDGECRDLAVLVAREWPLLHREAASFDPPRCLALLQRCDAWRRPERLRDALVAFDALAAASGDAVIEATVQRRCTLVRRSLEAAQAVHAALLPAGERDRAGPALGQALRDARLRAIAEAFARA